jgi:PAS domain S-box-containing protein
LREGTLICEYPLIPGSNFELSFSRIVVDGLVAGVSVFARDITQRKVSEEEHQDAERKYREIFEDAPEGIFRTTPDGIPIALNPAGATLLGYESPAQACREVGSFQDQVWHDPLDRVPFASALETSGKIRGYRTRFKRRDGSPIWVSIAANRVCGVDGQVLYYQGFCEDISGQIVVESELVVKLRELQLLSEMNNALLRARTERGLLEEYCRIIVEIGGYPMAWVGFAEDSADKPVVPVAHFGEERGLLESAGITWADTPGGSGPTGRAIRSGKVQVSEDIAVDPSMAPWREITLKLGYRSVISLPFRHSDGKMACLTAYGNRCAPWTDSERELMEQVSSQLGFGITTLRTALAKSRYQEQLNLSLEQTIQMISETFDQRDPYTAGHQRRVADLCTHIAREIDVPGDRIRGLTLAASIHDIGKIGIPAEILSKPGHLTPTQMSLLKEHVQLGCDIIKNVSFPWPIVDIVFQHHERIDGSGYPKGLTGESMLLESKILAVADAVEAMSSHRPYRAGLGLEPALEDVLENAGGLYDTEVVNACVLLFREKGYKFPD